MPETSDFDLVRSQARIRAALDGVITIDANGDAGAAVAHMLGHRARGNVVITM